MMNQDETEWSEVSQTDYAEGVAESNPGDEQPGDYTEGGGGSDRQTDLPGDGNQPAVSNPKFPPPTRNTR